VVRREWRTKTADGTCGNDETVKTVPEFLPGLSPFAVSHIYTPETWVLFSGTVRFPQASGPVTFEWDMSEVSINYGKGV
jgi:hypothetical protein